VWETTRHPWVTFDHHLDRFCGPAGNRGLRTGAAKPPRGSIGARICSGGGWV